MVRWPAPCVRATVRLAETAGALAGTPHWPAIGKSRGTPADNDGGPQAPVKPPPRVSSTRQGVSPTNRSGAVSSGNESVEGAGQFGTSWSWASAGPPAVAQARARYARRPFKLIDPPHRHPAAARDGPGALTFARADGQGPPARWIVWRI